MIRPQGGRPDWWTWANPPAEWCTQHAEVPGLQWRGNGWAVTAVDFHRSHLPLLPDYARQVIVEPDWVKVPVSFAGAVPLRPYQAEDLPKLLDMRGGLLAYEMRLGKTCLATMAHDPSDGPLVVCGPLAARDVWAEWITRIWGESPLCLSGRSNIDPAAAVGRKAYFCHYDVLEAWTAFFAREARIGTLVLDEVHLLQSRRARRTQAATVLAVRAARVLGLSGTPMWSSPDSMYSLLHLITPGAWGNHFDFARRYAGAQPGAHGWDYSGASSLDEFHARLDEIMIRRSWSQVASDLPPVTRIVETVDIAPGKLAELEMAALEASLMARTTTKAGVLATYRSKLAQAKIGPAAALAESTMRAGHKVVVWTWHNAVGDKIPGYISEDVGAVFRLKSSHTADQRAEILAAFRECAGPAALIIGLTVGGTAIDLSCATHAIFVELDWIPANVQQASMRTFSPLRPSCETYLIADLDVERRLIEALGVREGFAARAGLGEVEIARHVLAASVPGRLSGQSLDDVL